MSAIDIPDEIGAVDPELVERFRSDFSALCRWPGKIGVAVSGGPDSLALLLLTVGAFPNVEAVTVDHSLRSESADEAAFVERICAQLGVRHSSLPVTVADGNVQQNARDARYRALTDWAEKRSIDTLLTGHHADDQAETIMMRFNRASGLAGLCGIRASSGLSNKDTVLARPLLTWRRTELSTVVESAGIKPVDDPSNYSNDYDRVKMRKNLSGADWLDVNAVAKSAQHLAEAEQAIQSMVSYEWRERVQNDRDAIVYSPEGPPLIVKRVVEKAVAWFTGDAVRRSQIADLVEKLENREGGNVAGVLATAKDRVWTFRPEPPRKTG
ncbi:tRNA lysidine(34) synthetase TilS [Pontixanthobacter sp. CEM42]|uniref:tRNA lysidine(34) synthetase TilS n=1 Tax=Pontixanthobacter sp. CEM42 TaxID=2792077 RepID=UPI001ADECE9A|nr:tRNA lysidine(34) synthetase TilS [Pontixanthobacter sp. CEM42]